MTRSSQQTTARQNKASLTGGTSRLLKKGERVINTQGTKSSEGIRWMTMSHEVNGLPQAVGFKLGVERESSAAPWIHPCLEAGPCLRSPDPATDLEGKRTPTFLLAWMSRYLGLWKTPLRR